MPVKLTHNNYGKSSVRLIKVTRGPKQSFSEIRVNIQFEGAFEKVYTDGDNSNVLPTDTMKNTVYALAKNHPLGSIEEFGHALAKHFIDHNPDISLAEIEITEGLWNRIEIGGKPHPHAFTSAGNEKRYALVKLSKNNLIVEGGIRDLLILKTTGSAFKGYVKDPFTILKETDDRIFATNLNVTWVYSSPTIVFNEAYETSRQTLLEIFAEQHSLSVQHTVYAMGEAVIDRCPDISEIRITTPNKHCIPVNLEPFGLQNANDIFVPTDEPFGLIEGVITRK